LNSASPWNGYADQRFLEAIGGYARDRERGTEGITVAGLLVLGRPESLRSWRSRHLIDYRLVDDSSDLETRWDDRVVWEGNLLGAYDAIYPKIIAGQPVPFRLSSGVRVSEGPAHVDSAKLS
jgi:ATP-dependent DNA helicase RecG